MRILHLDAGLAMRGGQWQALRLADGLMRMGHEVTLLAREGSPLFEKAAVAGLPVRPLSLAAVASLSRTADVVHAHDARAHTLASLAARTSFVVARRVAFPIRLDVASRWKYRRAAHFIAVSNFVKGVLERSGVPAEKISVIYDGVLVPPHAGAVPPAGDFLALETDDPEKGMQLTIEAARLAGVELRLSRDLEADLKRASGFVYITRSEGLGSAVLLAMAAGVPVIASCVGGLPEVVEHGRTGLLTENNPAAIADAIRQLHFSSSLAAGMACAARKMVEERFSVGVMVRHTFDVYQKVA